MEILSSTFLLASVYRVINSIYGIFTFQHLSLPLLIIRILFFGLLFHSYLLSAILVNFFSHWLIVGECIPSSTLFLLIQSLLRLLLCPFIITVPFFFRFIFLLIMSNYICFHCYLFIFYSVCYNICRTQPF